MFDSLVDVNAIQRPRGKKSIPDSGKAKSAVPLGYTGGKGRERETGLSHEETKHTQLVRGAVTAGLLCLSNQAL